MPKVCVGRRGKDEKEKQIHAYGKKKGPAPESVESKAENDCGRTIDSADQPQHGAISCGLSSDQSGHHQSIQCAMDSGPLSPQGLGQTVLA